MVIIVMILAGLLSSCAGKGKELFRSKGCIRCHSFKGEGGNIGPDLTAVANRRSGSRIRQQIKNSKKHNPQSRMPDFSRLSEYEIRSIIAYFKRG
ncbi:MAG: c-type cytochrome [Nitrospiraceae bacterium]|nr:MAG: c-type cytochrome [Nitrospiraceae bacterium]